MSVNEVVVLIIQNAGDIGVGVGMLIFAFALLQMMRHQQSHFKVQAALVEVIEKQGEVSNQTIILSKAMVEASDRQSSAALQHGISMNATATSLKDAERALLEAKNTLSMLVTSSETVRQTLLTQVVTTLDGKLSPILVEAKTQTSILTELVNITRQDVASTLLHGIIILDGSARVVWINQAALRIVGIDSGEMIGRTISDAQWEMYTPDNQHLDLSSSMFAGKFARDSPAHQVVGIRARPQGRTQWVMVSAHPQYLPPPVHVVEAGGEAGGTGTSSLDDQRLGSLTLRLSPIGGMAMILDAGK